MGLGGTHNVFSQGGGTVLVDGLAGMGKTYFLRELAQQARQRAVAGDVPAADRIERGEPYSFIERFLAAGFVSDWDVETESKKQPFSVARVCSASAQQHERIRTRTHHSH